MMKKFLTVLIVGILAVSLIACDKTDKESSSLDDGENTAVENLEKQPDETENVSDINYDEGLSTERYDGYEYRMLVRAGATDTQNPEAETGDHVTDAIYRRNKAVEEKYGITITSVESSNSNYETDALNSILAGDDAYDIIFPHSRAAFAYAVQGATHNIHEIESIHLDKPWWTRDMVESSTIGGRLLVLDGDITMNLSRTMVLMFNKRIFDELGFDYPYETVKDGDWTFDEMSYYVKKGGSDLNGDGVMLPEDDRFGFTTYEWGGPINILYTGGQKIYDKNEEGVLELTLYSNKTVDIFDEFFGLMNNEACFMQFTDGNVNYTGPDIFKSGRSMINTTNLGMAKSLRDMDDDFGILPYPKFTEEDEYATVVNGSASLVIIPVTVSDVERTGAITEALCAYSARDVIPAFYDVSLKTKYARDEESEEMMDIIRDSVVYDLGYVAIGTFNSVGRELAKSDSRDFASFYASREAVAKTALADFNRDYGKQG